MTENDTQIATTQTAGEKAGFTGIQIDTADQQSLAAMTREQSEIQAAMVIAKRFERNELKSYNKLMEACSRFRFAEKAQYAFPRGGTTIKGPSINLAVEAGRIWGNLRHGIRIVKDERDKVHIKGYCFDCETNTYAEFEDSFKKLIQRNKWVGGQKVSEWVVPDERDLRELIFRRGAILVRNAILRVMPSDIIDAACDAADEAVAMKMRSGSQEDQVTMVRNLTVAFGRIGVTIDMLATRLGHDPQAITPEERTELIAVYNSINDGNSRRDEHFPPKKAEGEPETVGSKTKTLAASLKREKGQPKAAKKASKPAEATNVAPEGNEPTEGVALSEADLSAFRTKVKVAILKIEPEHRQPWMKTVNIKGLADVETMDAKDLASIWEAIPKEALP